jgi:hypothetical protein
MPGLAASACLLFGRLPRFRPPGALGLAALVGLASVACQGGSTPSAPSADRGAPPPPAASANAKPCASAPTKLSDPVSAPFFPPTFGSFCLDGSAPVAPMGADSKAPIADICNLYDGECEVYLKLDVKRAVEVRYVASDGPPTTVQVLLARFDTPAAAYAMFTKRVVGDGDPADASTPKPLDATGIAAIGMGNAYLVKGAHLAELVLTEENADEKRTDERARAVLPGLVKALSEKLPGGAERPSPASLLPAEGKLPLGERVVQRSVLGIDLGAQFAALGYYRDGDRRWRVLRVEGDGKKVAELAAKLPGAQASGGDVEFEEKEGATKARWVGRATATGFVAIGDEIRVMRGATDKVSLDATDKRKRLAALAGP